MSAPNIFRILLALSLMAGSGLRAANTLTYSPSSVVLICAKGSASCNTVPVGVTDAAGNDYFTINAATVPYWLQVSPMNGLATGTSQNLTFQVSAAAANLPVGEYAATVQITGSNLTNGVIPVALTVTDTAPGLSVQPADPINVNWQIGQAYPVISLTVFSTSTIPVPFTAATASTPTSLGVANWLSPFALNEIAYGWGTTIPLVVSTSAYQQAQAGETLAGTVTLTWGTSGTKTVHINISVAPPPVTIASISPSAVPVISVSSAGTVTIAVIGNNFVQNALQTTKVFTSSGSSVTLCSACTVHVLNSQNMTVAIPYDNTGVPFRAAGTLTIGLANGSASLPQATKNLTITTAPIITSVTSASTLVAPAGGSNPTVAPYDLISIFGSNFCLSSLAGCANPIVASLDPFFRYPTYLSPDNGTHKLSVLFSKTSSLGTAWANVPGYLLFANNNQINAVVPASIAAQLGTGTVKMVVGFDTSATSPAASASSAAYLLNVAAVDPGAFTLDSADDGAIMDASSFILNTQSTPAIGGSSIVAVYMTGLGTPDGTGSNAPVAGPNPPTTCLAPVGVVGNGTLAPTGYMGTVNTSVSGGGYVPPTGYAPPNPAWTSIDGAVIRSVLLSANVSPPCLGAVAANLPTVSIGGQSATVSYAGFVADSVAGLYQVNVAVPNVGNGSSAAQFPLIVTVQGVSAPPVQIWVQ